MKELKQFQKKVRAFVRARDWEQFHSPKNLAMALSVEASELVERFQWLTEKQSLALSVKDKVGVAEEIADVFVYLMLLCEKLDIDLLEESRKKIVKNEKKYPVALAKGRATKAAALRPKRKARS
jgi:NTP pyrophosphatase (non-canonical NTP hydrolase)